MKLTVTITNSATGLSYDIQFDSRQKIHTTLEVLEESIPELFMQIEKPFILQSVRSKRRLDDKKSYEDAHIFNGDHLMLVPQSLEEKRSESV